MTGRARSRLTFCVAWGLAALYVALLLGTARPIGYARDEGFYFQAADRYGAWLERLTANPDQALQRPVVEAHFRVNSEHPALMKLLFSVSHRLFYQDLGWIETPGTAYRLPTMLLAGLAVALLVLWGARRGNLGAGVVAGLLFMALPRVFHHAHLACFDVPVAAMTLAVAYCWDRAVRTRRLRSCVGAGLVMGLLLGTKHNGWIVLSVLVLDWLVRQAPRLLRERGRQRLFTLLPLVCVLSLAPLVLVAVWPWLWFDPLEKIQAWMRFHLHHDYYNMEFLGHTYHRPPMPLGYAWVMTAATVPLVTLILFALGLWAALTTLLPWLRRMVGSHQAPTQDPGTLWLWLVFLGAAYAPWLSPNTPIFGGTKHWLGAYPFLCLVAALGWTHLSRHWRLWAATRPGLLARRPQLPVWLGTAALLIGPVTMTLDSVPWGLSFYTPLVGGAPGAATLGLNRTFWGYTTQSLGPAIRQAKPNGGRLFVSDTALSAFAMMQRDEPWARAFVPTLHLPSSDIALYHHEPHMGRVEYQIWEAFGTTTPTAIQGFQGVPVVWMYVRPAAR